MIDIISNNPISSTVIAAAIIAIVGVICRKIKSGITRFNDTLATHERDHKDIKAALHSSNENDKLLLKSKIQDIHGRMMAKGALGLKDKELANELYERYHEMGGNGYIRILLAEINKEEELIHNE